jgi:hypothetical protein
MEDEQSYVYLQPKDENSERHNKKEKIGMKLEK